MEVDRTFSQWSIGSPRVKWSAVFAGWAVGLAVQMVLTLLGLGVGAWAIDLRDSNPAQGIPTGAGIWTGLSMLISAFIGGYVTARLSGNTDRADGMYHGVVVWGVNWLVFAWLTTTAMSTMIGGAFSVFGTTLQTLGQGLSSAASTAVSRMSGNLNVSTDDLRKEVESVLRASGKPELQPEEVKKDAGRVAGSAQAGRPLDQVTDSAMAELREKLAALDRQAAINIMVNRFGMSDAQARQVVQQTIGILGPIQETVQNVQQQSAAIGTQALDRLGTAAMWLSIVALITLVVSVIGGLAGTPDDSLVEASTRTESYRTDIRRAG
ncbi:MAG TPA: hypothetical protein VJ746_08420 [Nitrospira sp.]|nr:hypothetical protein [Nitrospira sp.]